MPPRFLCSSFSLFWGYSGIFGEIVKVQRAFKEIKKVKQCFRYFLSFFKVPKNVVIAYQITIVFHKRNMPWEFCENRSVFGRFSCFLMLYVSIQLHNLHFVIRFFLSPQIYIVIKLNELRFQVVGWVFSPMIRSDTLRRKSYHLKKHPKMIGPFLISIQACIKTWWYLIMYRR